MLLYINGQLAELDAGQVIAQTKQVNDLNSLDNRQTNYTNKFKLPKTATNIRIMNFLTLTGNESDVPYQKNECSLYSNNGECFVYNGWAVVTDGGDSYEAVVYDGIIDLYKTIENHNLSMLDLGEINHQKTFENIYRSWYEGSALNYKYILADYNGKTGYRKDGIYNAVNVDYLVPSINVAWLWNMIFSKYNIQYKGAVFNTQQFKNLWLSYPKGIITQDEGTEVFTCSEFSIINPEYKVKGLNIWYRRTCLFTYIPENNDYLNYFEADSEKFRLRAKERGNYKMHIKCKMNTKDSVRLFITKNVNSSTSAYVDALTEGIVITPDLGRDSEFEKDIFLELNTNDSISLLMRHRDGIQKAVQFSDPPEIEVTITRINKAEMNFGDAFADFSIRDFISEIVHRFGLTLFKDKYTGRYDFLTLQEILQSPDPADFSSKLVRKLSENYIYGNYAQSNWFRYNYNDKEDTHNDSFIAVANANLPEAKDVIKSKIYSPEKQTTGYLSRNGNIYKLWEKEIDDDPEEGQDPVKYKSLDKRFYFLRTEQVNSSIRLRFEATQEHTTQPSYWAESYWKLSFSDIVTDYYNPMKQLLSKSQIVTVIENLGNVPNGDFISKANTSDWNFYDLGTEGGAGEKTYYFSYETDGVLYFSQFTGTPGLYGLSYDTKFTTSDFVSSTDSRITDVPNMENVLLQGGNINVSQLINDGNGNSPYATVADIDGITIIVNQAAAEMYLKNNEGTILATISIGFLNNEGTTFFYNENTQKLELKNDAGELLSEVPVSAFISNLMHSVEFKASSQSLLEFKDASGNVIDSVTFSIDNISGLQSMLNTKVNIDGSNATGNWNILVEDSTKWEGLRRDAGNVVDPPHYITFNADGTAAGSTTKAQVIKSLGINLKSDADHVLHKTGNETKNGNLGLMGKIIYLLDDGEVQWETEVDENKNFIITNRYRTEIPSLKINETGNIEISNGKLSVLKAPTENNDVIRLLEFKTKADKNSSLTLKGNIGDAQNLNSFIQTGIYHQVSDTQALSGSNYPAPYAGKLEVVSNDYIYQTYHLYGSFNKFYYRSFYNDLWSIWREVANDSDVLHKVGNELKTGSLTIDHGNLNISAGYFIGLNSEWTIGYDTNLNGIKFSKTGVSNTNVFVEDDTGNVGIGTSVPSEKLHVNGNIVADAATNPNHVIIQSQLTSSLSTTINNIANNYVPKTGSITKNGTVTFTDSPIIPNATLANHAVNKAQLDASILSISSVIPTLQDVMNQESYANVNDFVYILSSKKISIGGLLGVSVQNTTSGAYITSENENISIYGGSKYGVSINGGTGNGDVVVTAKGGFHVNLTNNSNFNIKGDTGSFEGAKYTEDYSAFFTDRSLVDKAFVLKHFKSFNRETNINISGGSGTLTYTSDNFYYNDILTLFVDCLHGSKTIFIPNFSTMQGYTVNIIKTDTSSNTVTIQGNANINNASTYVLSTRYQKVSIKADQSQYYIF